MPLQRVAHLLRCCLPQPCRPLDVSEGERHCSRRHGHPGSLPRWSGHPLGIKPSCTATPLQQTYCIAYCGTAGSRMVAFRPIRASRPCCIAPRLPSTCHRRTRRRPRCAAAHLTWLDTDRGRTRRWESCGCRASCAASYGPSYGPSCVAWPVVCSARDAAPSSSGTTVAPSREWRGSRCTARTAPWDVIAVRWLAAIHRPADRLGCRGSHQRFQAPWRGAVSMVT